MVQWISPSCFKLIVEFKCGADTIRPKTQFSIRQCAGGFIMVWWVGSTCPLKYVTDWWLLYDSASWSFPPNSWTSCAPTTKCCSSRIMHCVIKHKLLRFDLKSILETSNAWCGHYICQTWEKWIIHLMWWRSLFVCKILHLHISGSYGDSMAQHFSQSFRISAMSIYCTSRDYTILDTYPMIFGLSIYKNKVIQWANFVLEFQHILQMTTLI